MKKSILSSGLIIALAFATSSVFATVWRVNSSPGSDPDYTSIQAAHDDNNVQNGDTLYIEGSATGVGALQSTKSLTIIGTGYYLSENPETQASPLSSTINGIWFQAGSEGSKVMGCEIPNSIRLYTSNVFITRCRIVANNAIQTYASNLANIVITQSYIRALSNHNYVCLSFSDASNVLVSNCYLYGVVSSNTNFSGIYTNNVIHGSVSIYNSVLKNNIHTFGTFSTSGYNNSYSYNIGYNGDFGTSNGNQSNVSMSSVFENFVALGIDNDFQLRSGSPAIGAGENGADCGMFGGAFPYILSGMPNIPSIYYLNTPPIPSDVIDVAIKAKSHN